MNNKITTGSITITDFKLYYRFIIIKTTYWNKNRQVAKWNQVEDPDIILYTYRQLIFFFLTKKSEIYSGENTASSTNGAGHM